MAFTEVPPPTRPMLNVVRGALSCDCLVTREGLIYASDWNGGVHVLQYEG